MLESSDIVAPFVVPHAERVSWRALLQNDWVVSGLLVLFSVIPTVALWRHAAYLTGDSYQYLRAAQSFSAGLGLKDMSGDAFTVLTPSFPLLIGIVHRLFGNLDVETIARFVSFAGATVALVAFYWLLRIRYSFWISFSAAMLFGLLPLRVWSSLWALSEGLYVGFLMLGLAVLFRSAKRLWLACLGGGLLGFAYLTRPEAILYFAAIVLIFAIKNLRYQKRTLAIVAGFLLVALPYHAWVYRATGRPSSGRLGILLSQSQAIYEGDLSKVLVFNQAGPNGISTDRLGSEMTVSSIGKRYAFYARIELQRLVYLLGPHLIVWGLFLVGSIRFVAKKRWRQIRDFRLVDAWPFVLASWLLFLPFLHVEDRYLLQVMPAFLLALTVVVVWIQEVVFKRLPRRLKSFAILIPLSFIALFALSYVFRLATQIPATDSSTLARNTARWLESQKLLPAPILSQAPDLAFFSGAKHLWMPDGEPEHVVTYAQRNGARYLYVSSQDVQTQLNELLLNSNAPPPASLRLLHEETNGTARGRLFEVNSKNRVISSNLHL